MIEEKQVKQTDKISVKDVSAFRIMIRGLLVMFLVAAVCALSFALLMSKAGDMENASKDTYQYHYALIADDGGDDFWDKVYEGATKEAELNNAYVERMGGILSSEYSTEKLMRMAINSAVDGIILYAEDTPEVEKLINQAVEKGIFVLTMRQDVDGSKRQCFVGVSGYDLGLEYGKQLVEILKEDPETKDISILVEKSTNESRQTLFTLGVRDALTEVLEEEQIPEMRMLKIDAMDPFSAEEAIRDIFIENSNLPDVLICLNSVYTQCAYQAVVDYNHVGDVKIIGYYASNTILSAIQKQIIYSSIQVDAEEIGRSSVNILNEYIQTGYANSYVPVGIKVIGEREAYWMLREVEKDEVSGK